MLFFVLNGLTLNVLMLRENSWRKTRIRLLQKMRKKHRYQRRKRHRQQRRKRKRSQKVALARKEKKQRKRMMKRHLNQKNKVTWHQTTVQRKRTGTPAQRKRMQMTKTTTKKTKKRISWNVNEGRKSSNSATPAGCCVKTSCWPCSSRPTLEDPPVKRVRSPWDW